MSLTRLSVLAVSAVLCSALTGCGGSASPETNELDAAFEQASAEYRIPKQLLIGIGFVQTRLWMHAGEQGIGNTYGLMQLADRGPDSSLQRAALLTGLSLEELKLDPESNIRGAAAVLRADANRYFGEYPGKREDELAHWWQVVMRYPGYVDAYASEVFASEVFQVVRKGFSIQIEDGSVFHHPGTWVDTADEDIFGHSEFALFPTSSDYPSAEVHSADPGNYWAGPRAFPRSGCVQPGNNCTGPSCIEMIVIHVAEGTWTGTWSWFADPAAPASAHYTVESDYDDPKYSTIKVPGRSRVAQSVADADTAWHAGNCSTNLHSIGIEHEGHSSNGAWFTNAMYQSSANLTRWLCDTYKIPKDRAHIIGHNEVPGRTGSLHTDPCVTLDGSTCYWDWAKYMSLVNPVSTGTVWGKVFSSEGGATPSPNTKPIANATVTVVGGGTYTTDSTGMFTFTTSVGDYTLTASASGYSSAAPYLGNPRTVTANATTYSSFVLTPMPTSGTLNVYVYEVQSGNAADKSHALNGALVSINGSSATSTPAGAASFNLPPGSQSISVTKSGYASKTTTTTITAGGSVLVEIGLIAAPTAGTLNVYVYEVQSGNASDKSKALLNALVSVGGNAATTTLAGNATFSLPAGSASVTVSKGGYNSKTATASITAGNTTSIEVGLALVPTTGTLNVFVYELNANNPSDKSKPVSGASISAGGLTATAAANGSSTFTLATGSHTVSVSKSSYDPSTASANITSGGTTSIEVALKPVATQAIGTVSVLVYETNPTNAADQSRPLSGATVIIDGKSATTGNDGKCQIQANAGTRLVQVAKSGFISDSRTANVGSNTTVSVQVGLTSSNDAAPTVVFTSPADGFVFQTVPITVNGYATGRKVAVTINSVSTMLAVNGTFSSSVSPPPGEGAIEAVARDEFGREATATLRVVYDHFDSGVQGKVVDAMTGQAISGAVLTSGAVVAQTEANGTYTMTLPAGSQAITVQAGSNYLAREVTVSVPAGSRFFRDIELIPAVSESALTITSPTDGATVAGESVEVSGTVKFAQLASIKANGVEATLAQGTYKATVKVPGGTKTAIKVVARTFDGIEKSVSITVTGTAAATKEEGCTSAGAASVLALLGLLVGRRRGR